MNTIEKKCDACGSVIFTTVTTSGDGRTTYGSTHAFDLSGGPAGKMRGEWSACSPKCLGDLAARIAGA